EFYIQADCGATAGVSTWVGPIAFTTACDGFSAPFVETFATTSTPNCWTETGDEAWIYSTNADYDAISAGNNTFEGSTYCARIDRSGTVDTISTFTSPLVDDSSLTTTSIFLSIYSENSDDNTYNTITAEFNDGTPWTIIYTLQGATGGWSNIVIDLSS